MSEIAASSVTPPRRYSPQWFWSVFLRPRRAFEEIAGYTRGVWLPALLVLSLTAVLLVVVNASTGQSTGMPGPEGMATDMSFYSPEELAQLEQAVQAANGPVFRYVIPSVIALGAVWVGWLIVGGSLHLLLTLFGARGTNTERMNITAWAGLPFALRDIVRIVAVLIGGSAIAAPGLSGFIDPEATGLAAYFGQFLRVVDIYMIWNIALLVVGARALDPNLGRGRLIVGIGLLVLVLYLVQALLGYGVNQLSNMSLMGPFFF